MSIIEKALERLEGGDGPSRKGAGKESAESGVKPTSATQDESSAYAAPSHIADSLDGEKPNEQYDPTSSDFEKVGFGSSPDPLAQLDNDAAALDLSADFAIARAEAGARVEAPSAAPDGAGDATFSKLADEPTSDTIQSDKPNDIQDDAPLVPEMPSLGIQAHQPKKSDTSPEVDTAPSQTHGGGAGFQEAHIPELKGWVQNPEQVDDAVSTPMLSQIPAAAAISGRQAGVWTESSIQNEAADEFEGNDDETVIHPPSPAGSGRPSQAASDAAQQTKSRLVDINIDRLEAIGMLTPKSDNSLLAEQYRAIKRPVLMQMGGDPAQRPANANLVMLASALPNEGKTSTAINLAISMAQERDKTVLLVDGDVAKSDITKILDIEAELGLTDLLADSSLTVADVMIKTSIPKLSVMPAGTRMPNLTELFASRNMRELMADFAQRYSDRIVVLDSPPLLAASGASVLASLAGQILLVIEAVRTPQRAVNEALRLLGPLDNIGLVLNKVRHTPSEYGYNYSYGYGYGYGQ